jgi:STE24 endopeptidase
MTISIEMSDNRKKKAKEYASLKRLLFFINTGLLLAYLLLMLFTGLSLELRKLVEGWSSNQWLVVPLYVLIFGGVYGLLTFPLDVYSGWFLPRKYGQSIQSFRGWLIDMVKGLVISGLIMLVLLELLYLALRSTPEWWWLVAGVFYLFFVVVLSTLAPVLIMPLFNKFIPLENDELRERMLQLGKKTGAKVKGVYTMDFSRRTRDANAFVTGIGGTRRIVLGDTLTQNFTPDEIEVVMAHELGHHVHGDIWRGLTFDSAVTLIGLFVANLILKATLSSFNYREVGDIAAFPLLVLIMMGFGLVTMPLTNAYSRSREKAADDYALKITENVQSFITSMKKLANQNLSDTEPPAWVVLLFHTHPPIGARVRNGEEYARQRGLNPYSFENSPETRVS